MLKIGNADSHGHFMTEPNTKDIQNAAGHCTYSQTTGH